MKNLLVALLMVISVCRGQGDVIDKNPQLNDSIIINNNTDPIPPVTEYPPGPPSPNVTTSTPTPVTTPSSTTVNPNSTTTATTPTTTAKTTTVSPTTTTTKVPTTTPNVTTTTSNPSPTTASTTKLPPTKTPATTETPIPSNNRKFDGPSFVGGIVLASGLMAISFVAFKFYKARTELNYHTL